MHVRMRCCSVFTTPGACLRWGGRFYRDSSAELGKYSSRDDSHHLLGTLGWEAWQPEAQVQLIDTDRLVSPYLFDARLWRPNYPELRDELWERL